MIFFYTPNDKKFNHAEAKKLWKQYSEKLDDGGDFENLLKNSHFFSFYDDDKLIGCMCFYQKNGKIFFNGFSERKTHQTNLKCIEKALTFYNQAIYAKSIEKPAVFCLLRAGFKKIGENLYMKGNKNG